MCDDDGHNLAVDRISDELMHHSRDGGVEDEGDEEEEPKHADDGQGAEEQGGVVLDLVHAGGRLLGLTHGGINLRHDDTLLLSRHKMFKGKERLNWIFLAALCLYSGRWTEPGLCLTTKALGDY